MEDQEIVRRYWQRDETAIQATQQKYGAFCTGIAQSILGSSEDAQECLNDLLHRAWQSIPPQRPQRLQVWLGRVMRNLALDRWRQCHSQKRDAGLPVLLEELEDCLPAAMTTEAGAEARELTRCIERWLRELPAGDRALFVRRYWCGEALASLAAQAGMTPARLARHMYRLRCSLRAALEKEDITL